MRFYVGGGMTGLEDTVELSRLSDKVGFDGVTFGEHVVMAAEPSTPYPHSPDGKPSFALDAPWPDVWVLVGALSMVTTRIHFLSTVYLLPLRNPLVTAKAVGTAAVLSGGRAELGVGVGWQRDEFEALGMDFSTRGARADESIEVLRKLWQPGPSEHEGRFYRYASAFMEPTPDRIPPIYVGGDSPAAMRRAAVHGDGYISMPAPIDQLESVVHEVRSQVQHLEDEGIRKAGPFTIFGNCSQATDADDYRRVAELGVDVALVRPVNLRPESSSRAGVADSIKRFADEIIAKVELNS